jgi:hypothetical protein
MPSLITDPQGFLRFAAISDTWLGSRTARLEDLDWFYRSLPDHGVSTVLHLGGAVGRDVESTVEYPSVEGVSTYENMNALQPLLWPRLTLAAAERVELLGGSLQLVHGADSSVSANLLLLYAPRTNLKARVRELAGLYDPPAITLIGGTRKVAYRAYHPVAARPRHGLRAPCFVATVGVFSAPLNTRHPPKPFGGSLIEVKLEPDGSVDTCLVRFRDMSGGMPDERSASDSRSGNGTRAVSEVQGTPTLLDTG